MSGIDMHVHSVASDGNCTVREIVALAKTKGLDGVAITDHDTVQGLAEIDVISREERFPIFPGIEISTVWEGQSIHVLGYLFDKDNETLLSWLAERQRERIERVKNILNQLKELGIELDEEAIFAQQNLGSLGRVHIGQAMIKAGYTYTLDQVFRKWLGEDGPIVIPPHKVTPRDAVNVIHQAGGLAVLGHPGLSHCDQWLDLFCDWKLDGIEVVHPEHKKKQRKRYRQYAEDHGLFVTAGSDFHRDGLGRCAIEIGDLPKRFHRFISDVEGPCS